MGMIIGIVVCMLVLVGLVAFFAMRKSDDKQDGADSGAFGRTGSFTDKSDRSVNNPMYGDSEANPEVTYGEFGSDGGYMDVNGAFAVGDQVMVQGKGHGVVRFVGPHAETGRPRIGVQLDRAVGKNNGTVKVRTRHRHRC